MCEKLFQYFYYCFFSLSKNIVDQLLQLYIFNFFGRYNLICNYTFYFTIHTSVREKSSMSITFLYFDILLYYRAKKQLTSFHIHHNIFSERTQTSEHSRPRKSDAITFE